MCLDFDLFCLHVCTVCIWRCQHAIFIHSLVNTLESHGSVHTDHGIKLQLVQDGKTQLSEIDMICNNWRREGSVCLLSIELYSHSRSASQRKRASRATCTGKIVSVSSETWGNLCLQSIQWVTPSPLLIYCDCDHRHNPKSQSNIFSSKRKANKNKMLENCKLSKVSSRSCAPDKMALLNSPPLERKK